MTEARKSALLIVDVQNDFCEGGALAVNGGNAVVSPLNHAIEAARQQGEPIYATRDWHPPDTHHFKAYGGLWPPHCVQHTHGARFHPRLRLPGDAIVITSGDTVESEGYSAFEGHTGSGQSFEDSLREKGIGHLWVGGLATDYCVRQSVLDALGAGLEVTVFTDAIAGVNVKPGDSTRAIEEMRRAGASFATTHQMSAEPVGAHRKTR